MERKIILTVRVEATFARKVKTSQHKRDILKRLKAVELPSPWKITTASIKSHATKTGKTVEKLKKEHEEVVVRKRSEKTERLQLTRQIEKEIGQRVRERLAEVREIAAEMKKAMPRTFPVIRMRVVWDITRRCGSKIKWCHTHSDSSPQNTICFNPDWLLWVSRKALEEVLAHELSHLVKKGKGQGHYTKKFNDRFAETLASYYSNRDEDWNEDHKSLNDVWTEWGWGVRKEVKHRFEEGDRIKVRNVWSSHKEDVGKLGDVLGVEDDGKVLVQLDDLKDAPNDKYGFKPLNYFGANQLRKVV